jgi:hypothetical protein
MTEQECIKYLEQHGHIADDVKDICIKALEKQIAKKVLIKHHEKTPWTREISQYLCPCCNRVIGFNGQIHCSTCGQKLLYDWGNEDAD